MTSKKVTLLFLALFVTLFSSGSLMQAAHAASSRVAVIKELTGTVQVKKSGGSKLFKAFSRMSLNEGDVLTTESDSTAVLQFSNGSSEDDRMSVSGNSTLTFSKLSDRQGTRTKVSLFNGTAWVDVKSITTPNDEFTLETPTAIMGVRGTHLLVGVDPLSGSTRLTVAAGVVSATTGGNSESMDVLPNQDAVFTEEDDDVSIAPTDLALLMGQSDASIVEAILKAAGDIVKENEEKKDLYVQQSGVQGTEDQARLKSNVENLLGAIVDQAVKSGQISGERANALVAESQAQTGVKIDLSKKEITLSETEKRQQVEQKNRADEAKKAADAQKKKEDEARKQNDALLKKLEEERQKKAEALKQAEANKKADAVKAYLSQLDESQKKSFTQEQQNRQQESTNTPTPTPTPTPPPAVFTVSFQSDGGTAIASQTVNEAGVVTWPVEPTKTGYVFVGWYRDSGLTQSFDFGTPITADTTLYAKWEINTYAVSFQSNGGSEIASQAVQYGDTADLPTSPTRTNYSFAGWYTGSDLTQAYTFGTPIIGDTTLYAKWSINTYLLQYSTDGNGIISGSVTQNVYYGGSGTAVTAMPNTGYHFTAWSDGVQTAARSDANVTANITVTAQFAVNAYTVSFNSNGGSTVASQTINHGSTAGTPSEPTMSGYMFVGWYSDSSLTQAFDFGTQITGDTTLYAKWQKLNGLLNAGFESPSIPFGPDYTGFEYAPVATGWTFNGNYAGIEHNTSNFDAPDAKEGVQAAILQMEGSFSQSVAFSAGYYNISFLAASRPGNHQYFDVLLDSTVIGSFDTTVHDFILFTTNSFAVTAGVHTLTFVGKTTADTTAFIDDIKINEVILPNLAAGKTPTTSASTSSILSNVTDGDIGDHWDGGTGLVWLQIDLEASYNIQKINLWHYYEGYARTYHDVIVQLSNTADFSSGVTTVFNNDSDNSAGFGVGTEAEYGETSAGKSIEFDPIGARYVRIWSNGSDVNEANHVVELEVYGVIY